MRETWHVRHASWWRRLRHWWTCGGGYWWYDPTTHEQGCGFCDFCYWQTYATPTPSEEPTR